MKKLLKQWLLRLDKDITKVQLHYSEYSSELDEALTEVSHRIRDEIK